MAELGPKDIQEIARLARLELGPEESEQLGRELASILAHMDKLADVDTEGVEPLYHAYPMPVRLREDEVGTSLDAESVLKEAPDHADQCFRVPNILGRTTD
jgi:aspartyl-tRNA(Asn)/glutamyl-tRNA(Gln) amidotransferase subunit C